MTTTTPALAVDHRRSVFAGADVCHEAGLTLPAGARRPVFENDLWDFTEVIGLPNQMAKVSRRFDFAAIINTGWRQVAKEQVVAMLAPRHDAVAPLPRAYRTPLHLLTVFGRLAELTRFLNWLTGRGVTALADVDDHQCQAFLLTGVTSATRTTWSSANSAPRPARPPPRSSSTWPTTGNCSAPTRSGPAGRHGRAPPRPRSPKCPAGQDITRPRR